MKSEILEIGAFVAKTAVDHSDLPQNNKEWIKLIIDGAKEFVQAYQPPKQLNVHTIGMNSAWKDCIVSAADECSLTQVRVLPYMLRGQPAFAFIMYGGDIDGFCCRTGITRISNSISLREHGEIDTLFQTHGILLFSRSKN